MGGGQVRGCHLFCPLYSHLTGDGEEETQGSSTSAESSIERATKTAKRTQADQQEGQLDRPGQKNTAQES